MDDADVRPGARFRGFRSAALEAAVLLRYLTLLAAIVCSQPALPHGSVVDEDDLCLINMGFYRAHFTIYQPGSSGHDEYCEDLPGTGETVFVVDYLHDAMRTVPLDFRIVRDRHGVGQFARYEDVLALDLEADTVFFQPATTRPDGVYTVLHEFEETGGYIGVVTVGHPTSSDVYRAVFPFEVGLLPFDYLLWGGGFVLVSGIPLWWLLSQRRNRVARAVA